MLEGATKVKTSEFATHMIQNMAAGAGGEVGKFCSIESGGAGLQACVAKV